MYGSGIDNNSHAIQAQAPFSIVEIKGAGVVSWQDQLRSGRPPGCPVAHALLLEPLPIMSK